VDEQAHQRIRRYKPDQQHDHCQADREVDAIGRHDQQHIAVAGAKRQRHADRQREVAIANAYRDAQKIKGEGDAEAARIYAEAFGRDPQFAQFYRSLEAYKASFSKKSDLMVVDPSSSEFFKAMRGGAAVPAKK